MKNIRKGHYYAAKYKGEGGDMTVAIVDSVRSKSNIVLVNILTGHKSTMKVSVFLSRHKRVTKNAAGKIVAAFHAKGVDARLVAVVTSEYISPKDRPLTLPFCDGTKPRRKPEKKEEAEAGAKGMVEQGAAEKSKSDAEWVMYAERHVRLARNVYNRHLVKHALLSSMASAFSGDLKFTVDGFFSAIERVNTYRNCASPHPDVLASMLVMEKRKLTSIVDTIKRGAGDYENFIDMMIMELKKQARELETRDTTEGKR